MKKILIATGIAALAFVTVAAAQGYQFNTNLTVGSTGPDVVALQTWLITNGYSIPAIASGAAQKGYFGSETQTAVKAYQTAAGLPSTGFVGPLTRAKLNAGGTAVAPSGTSVIPCPVGYACVPNTPVAATCPAGMICTPLAGTTGTITAPAGITTPGVAGTLAVSLWTTPSGVTAYKGQTYDVAGYKLQANASDMAVSNFSLDFDTRIWLYASAITVKDETGAVVGSVSNLNVSNFSELTVGSDYRIAIPVNLVVKAAQSKYLTISLTFNAVSDRSSGTITITQAQVRSVDGTGITDTETVNAGNTDLVAGIIGTRSFSYQGTNVGQLVVTADSSSPATGLIQVSTAAQTQGVVLGIFDVKVQNEPGTLQELDVAINSLAGTDAQHALAQVQLKVNGQTYAASQIGTTTKFTNLNVQLPADTYVPMTILATAVQDTNAVIDNTQLQVSLTPAGTASTDSTFNPSIIDATYNSVVNSSVSPLVANPQSFTSTGVTQTNMSTTFATKSCDQTLATCSQVFKFIYSLTAGNNPVYVSTDAAAAISVTHSATFTISTTTKDFSDSDSSQDDTNGNFFYIGPGSTKTFTVTYQANGANTDSGTISVSSLNYGTASGYPAAQHLQSSQITSTLKAVLFQ